MVHLLIQYALYTFFLIQYHPTFLPRLALLPRRSAAALFSLRRAAQWAPSEQASMCATASATPPSTNSPEALKQLNVKYQIFLKQKIFNTVPCFQNTVT